MSAGRFQFALSPALQLRTRAVDAARQALVRAARARAVAEATLARAEADLAGSLAADASPRTARQFGGASSHRSSLARAARSARQTADRLRTDETHARRALATALRAQEALVTLRDQAADAHRVRAHRREIAGLDDLTTAGRAARALTSTSTSTS
ncbi:hypothetical protein [Rubrivirga sp.]|uniref:hypothetical protein n=1 Tax=Rubrivirga sp. TaxID=1885344 RepID=UPI003B51A9C9